MKPGSVSSLKAWMGLLSILLKPVSVLPLRINEGNYVWI
ncbi:hypothetical protein J2T26_001318 [Citrobacter farmeri]|nr:hypothetical protein [Citrobacter farmeri]MCW2420702.1 hypothetical protein [Citrobacter farmeri]